MNNTYHTINTANKKHIVLFSKDAIGQLEDKLYINFNTKNNDQFNQCVNWYREFMRYMNDLAGDQTISSPNEINEKQMGVFDLNFLGSLVYHHLYIPQEQKSVILIEYFDFKSNPSTYPLVEKKPDNPIVNFARRMNIIP